MTLPRHHLELLAPARDAEIGREAILHGADAVYIGGPSFGARNKAENTVADIAGLVAFAHRYGARIFATVNTILHDSELELARALIHQLYDAGVDALIVQDMGILELDIPPIALHASTQCDIRTVEKAQFLGEVGFSQLVLARELTIPQIREMRAAVSADVPLEYFIHGALCVAFSGNCYISEAHTGRSANRGGCSQECRLPYTLEDAQGRVVAFDKHLLSMKDNNQSANLRALIDAGIRSFKIEGRYKDMSYVKNVTAHYRQLLDEILEARPDLAAASHGRSRFTFTPDPDKTFNRQSTDYFATGRKTDIGAFDAPVHVGRTVGTVTRVAADWFEVSPHEPETRMANGDGLTWMHKREVKGTQVNVATAIGDVWRVSPNQGLRELEAAGLKPGVVLSRNRDHAWENALGKKSAERRIDVALRLEETADGFALQVRDETGACGTATVVLPHESAQSADRATATLRDNLAKLGTTIFSATEIDIAWTAPWFVPASTANALRRDAIAALEVDRAARLARWTRRAATVPPVPYPATSLSYLANVYNQAARDFYAKHGVTMIDAAYEAHEEGGEVPLMVTKHCLRFSFNLCPKQAKGVQGVQGQVRAEPMTLISGGDRLTLKFDCKPCEMHVMGKMRSHILRAPPPSSVPIVASPLKFYARRPATETA
ncbi:MAG: U32 family peptidase [Burkholderiales bacterium]|nr:U32 family peptidase [Burkholderiales bacterium]